MNKKSSSAFAFNSGDFVVYPAHGVGKIADIAKQKIAGSELELIVVNFDKDKMTLRIPMAKAENIGLRKISGADTMNDALSVLKGKAKVKKIMWSRRAQEYENKNQFRQSGCDCRSCPRFVPQREFGRTVLQRAADL